MQLLPTIVSQGFRLWHDPVTELLLIASRDLCQERPLLWGHKLNAGNRHARALDLRPSSMPVARTNAQWQRTFFGPFRQGPRRTSEAQLSGDTRGSRWRSQRRPPPRTNRLDVTRFASRILKVSRLSGDESSAAKRAGVFTRNAVSSLNGCKSRTENSAIRRDLSQPQLLDVNVRLTWRS